MGSPDKPANDNGGVGVAWASGSSPKAEIVRLFLSVLGLDPGTHCKRLPHFLPTFLLPPILPPPNVTIGDIRRV